MSNIVIQDIQADRKMDQRAMASVWGGAGCGTPNRKGLDVCGPSFAPQNRQPMPFLGRLPVIGRFFWTPKR